MIIDLKRKMELIAYGALWRAHRKLYHQHLGPKAMEQYSVRIETEARAFAARLLENDREVMQSAEIVRAPSR